MGQLYDLSRQVTEEIEAGYSPIEQIALRGRLAKEAGFMVTMVGPHDPDDADKMQALRAAAREVLGVTV